MCLDTPSAMPIDPASRSSFEHLRDIIHHELVARIAIGNDPTTPEGPQAPSELIADAILDHFHVTPRVTLAFRLRGTSKCHRAPLEGARLHRPVHTKMSSEIPAPTNCGRDLREEPREPCARLGVRLRPALASVSENSPMSAVMVVA